MINLEIFDHFDLLNQTWQFGTPSGLISVVYVKACGEKDVRNQTHRLWATWRKFKTAPYRATFRKLIFTKISAWFELPSKAICYRVGSQFLSALK